MLLVSSRNYLLIAQYFFSSSQFDSAGYHSIKAGSAQLGNSLVHVQVQVVHKFGYCLCATWKLLGK